MFGKCCLVMAGSAAVLAGAAFGDVSPSAWIDPSIGTAATGHVFPGPCRPFGLVQPSSDTGNGSWKYCSGYAWTDTSVRRFSQTHVSGTGQAGLGDVGILPFVGDIPDPQTASAPFAKSTERIGLGYYGVTMESGVKVEIAPGRRLARYRMTFPAGSRGGVLLDFPWGLYRQKEYLPHLTTACEVSRVGARRWVGSNHSEVWAPRDIHYVVEFDRAPEEVVDLPRSAKGPRAAAIFPDGGVVELAIALSANSQAGALRNFDAECGCGFDRLVRETRTEWDRILSRIRWDQVVSGERKSVATAVYHLCVQPNEISDVGEPVRYSTFSLWDTFRDAHPLYEKLVPERVSGFVNSLLAHYDRWGYLPQWELWGRETGGMIGSHAVPVIVDAVEHGFGGFDKAKAYRAVRDTLRKSERPGMGLTYPRRTDWEVLDRYGYYPYDVIERESVSRTLECCYDDACAARFAKAMGKDEDAAFFERRSWAFTNLFDAATCCFRPKDSKGLWLKDFNPAGLSPHFTEGSALQWSWYVLHRPEWLVGAMGGKDAFEKRLDAFFAGSLLPGADRGNCQDITGLIGDYAHGNEPCHHVIGLYRLIGRNDKAVALEKRICQEFYRPAPDGLCGNDDCGQMSAWYLRRCCEGGELAVVSKEPVETVRLSADGEATLACYPMVVSSNLSAAVVICPGGGYRELCDTYEGVEMAKWLTARGIAAFVLRYRLSPRWHKDAMLADVRSALECVRRRAAEWRIDPRKVGVLGFSAGGHLACMAGTATESFHPDFMALVYPHVSMARGLGSEHMRMAFLGPGYPESEIEMYSGENRVTCDTPRTFIVHARTDEICPVEHSRRFVAVLQARGCPVEYVELPSGRHGLGCGTGVDWCAWLNAFDAWLRKEGLTK